MRNLRQNKHRSNRSNAWSGSKSSNQSKFDPYLSEWALVRADRNPTSTIILSDELKIDIYMRPLRDTFVRPFSIDDLEKTLQSVPLIFLYGLERIILFGGTKKQELTAGRMFRDGMYSYGAPLEMPFFGSTSGFNRTIIEFRGNFHDFRPVFSF